MKVKEKTNFFVMIAAWVSIVINDLIFFIFCFINKEVDSLKVAIVSAVGLAFMGVFKIIRDATVDDLLGSVICTWLGFLFLSAIGAYYLFDISIVGFVILIVFLMLEISSIFIIINRYRIRNYFKKKINRKQNDS
jgi:hypothetical protein